MDIDLSTLPGLRARRYRGPSDHPAMAAAMNRWYRAVGIEEVTTTEDLDHNYAHLENCDPFIDMVLVESAEGRLAGYTRTHWRQVEGGERKYAVFAKLDPDWEDSGLAVALLTAARSHAGITAATHAVDCPQVFEGWAESRETPLVEAYGSLGFSPVTYAAAMVRPHLDDIPEFAMPAGLEIRPVKESHLRAIWEADKVAFRDHWGYSEPTEDDFARFLEFPHRDESLWKVAWEGDQVVGQVRSFINEAENSELGLQRGWTEFISTRREWRKCGVAKALICESLRELESRGMTDAALGVHTENPTGAFQLYESLGYEVREQHTTYQQPVS